MKTDKEFADEVHMLIHSLRLIPNYKANPSEIKLSRMVIDKFKDSCSDCKEASERIKNQPEKKGILKKLGELADGSSN